MGTVALKPKHSSKKNNERATEARGASRFRDDHEAGGFKRGGIHLPYVSIGNNGSVNLDIDDPSYSPANWRGYVRAAVAAGVLAESYLRSRGLFPDAAPTPDPLATLRRQVAEQAIEIASLRAQLAAIRGLAIADVCEAAE